MTELRLGTKGATGRIEVFFCASMRSIAVFIVRRCLTYKTDVHGNVVKDILV